MIYSRNSQKNLRYFTITQEIFQKTHENFRKTQVFANSELEIVAEKRPKKALIKSFKHFQNSRMFLTQNGYRRKT